MKRREFLGTVAAAGLTPALGEFARAQEDHALCHPTYASPADAMKAVSYTHLTLPTILLL